MGGRRPGSVAAAPSPGAGGGERLREVPGRVGGPEGGGPAGLGRAPVSPAEAELPTARCVARSVREGGAGS